MNTWNQTRLVGVIAVILIIGTGLYIGATKDTPKEKIVVTYTSAEPVKPINLPELPAYTPLASTVYLSNASGGATGVVIDKSGIILTAAHVIMLSGGPDRLEVTLPDGTKCGIIGAYLFVDRDLAFIKIDTEAELEPIRWGDSDDLCAGDSITIVGAPFGERDWHSYGYVSRLPKKGFVSLDIAANPGNSGCGAYDKENRLVGMVISGIYGADGICRAVSSNMCRLYFEVYKRLNGIE